MIIINPICMKCKHFKPGLQEEGLFYCDAFTEPEVWTEEELKQRQAEGITLDPKGIPDEIIFGENDHSKPLENQSNDIIFEELK